MPRQAKLYGAKVVDGQTGEIYEGIVLLYQRGIGGKWVRVFQNVLNDLVDRSPNIHGQSWKILHYLEALVEWRNRIPTPAELAEKKGLLRTSVARAYGELMAGELIYKRGRDYYLSPIVAWRGNKKELEEAQELLFPSSIKALPSPATIRELPAPYITKRKSKP